MSEVALEVNELSEREEEEGEEGACLFEWPRGSLVGNPDFCAEKVAAERILLGTGAPPKLSNLYVELVRVSRNGCPASSFEESAGCFGDV